MLRRHGRMIRLGQRGSAVLEFAVVAPVIMTMLLSVFDLGTALQRSLHLQAAARAGAQYAFTHPTDTSGITTTINANLVGWTGVTVNPPTLVCKCDNGSTVTCAGGSCVTGVSTPITYVTISLSQPFRAISPLTRGMFSHLTRVQGAVQLRVN